MSELYVFAVGMALGFSLVIPPGPMNALIMVRSVHSLRAGVMTGLGAMTADVILGALVWLLHTLVNLAPVVRWAEAVGAVVMAYFAYRVLGRTRPLEPPSTEQDVRVYSIALAAAVTNPFQIVWWLTAGLAFAYLGGMLLLGGLFLAIAVWVVTFPYVLHQGARRSERFPRAVAVVSGFLFAGFAVYAALLAAGVTL